MDITQEQIPWLSKDHPNYKKWKYARDISIGRGKFVKSIIINFSECKKLRILDLGSGEGGTSAVLSENNEVISIDISKIRLQRYAGSGYKNAVICGDALFMPFKEKSFDIIILQDVIEHLNNLEIVINNLNKILSDGGIIYLSTPNKYSFINFIADPHWGAPFISLFNRQQTKKYFLKYFRKSEENRKDIPELLSLNKILNLFYQFFNVHLFTSHSVNELFKGNKGILWSNFHLNLLKIANGLKLNKIIIKIANDKTGFVNKFITPTLYFVLVKK